MVGPLTVLKMLHCRNISSQSSKKTFIKQIKRNPGKGTSRELRDGNLRDSIVNVDVKLEPSTELCRVCLREGSLPIFGNLETEDLADALCSIGAIEMSIDDSYPKHLCQPCHALLQGAILLRKTAQESDGLLKKTKSQTPEQSDQDPIPEMDDDFNDLSCNTEDKQFNIEDENTKTSKFLTCKRCNLQFNSFEEYSEHRISSEHENKRHLCPICKNSYAPDYIKRHMALHKQETSYMCDICGKNFIVQSQFTRHRLTHFYNLPFKCTLCPYKGRFSESLKMHMRSHTGEKPYQCAQCPSRFINKSNLNKHMLTHRGEHDFRCEFCGRGFYTKRDLDTHFKVDHTGIKDHICRFCDKAFGYRKQMMKHELKVHKREKLRTGRMPIYLRLERMKKQDTLEQ